MSLSEFDIIGCFFSSLGTRRKDVRVGVGDDGAVIAVPPGHELVVAVDTMIEGRHFLTDALAEEVGYKALAVNLSDLAAMGADPAWFTLALSLPTANESWLQEFAAGLSSLATRFNIQLIGGDTTRGPLTVSITVGGYLPQGCALPRSGARPGDAVFVSGTLGDAACCFAYADKCSRNAENDFLQGRLNRPEPRVALGRFLRGRASACIDISDGLAADLGHILRASHVGARINVDALPASDSFRAVCADHSERLELMLTGGDDYELCFCVPAEHKLSIYKSISEFGCNVTEVGEIRESEELRLVYDDGTQFELMTSGFDHFQGSPA